MSLKQWHSEGILLFGEDVENWTVVCPSCGHPQSRRDFSQLRLRGHIADMMFAFSCIGNWLNPAMAVGFSEPSTGFGCNYHGDAGRNISPLTVILPTDPQQERPTFRWSKST